jgi:hypothetical protein
MLAFWTGLREVTTTRMGGSQEDDGSGGDWFFLQAIAVLAGVGAFVFFFERTIFDDANAFFIAGVTGGIGLLVLGYRRFGEPTGSRRNPGPDDYVLSRRERTWSFFAACGLFALAYICRYTLTSIGARETLADVVWFVPGFPAFLLLWRAIWGVDQNDAD